MDIIVSSFIIKLIYFKEFYMTIGFAPLSLQSQLGGKLLIFQNTLPSLGVGRLKLRGDDLRVYGTDKEHLLRLPEDPFYKQMAAEFTKFQIGVNVYAFSDKYTDIASLGMPLISYLFIFGKKRKLFIRKDHEGQPKEAGTRSPFIFSLENVFVVT